MSMLLCTDDTIRLKQLSLKSHCFAFQCGSITGMFKSAIIRFHVSFSIVLSLTVDFIYILICTYVLRVRCINWYLYLYRNDAKIWCKEWHESKIIKHEMLTFLLLNVVYTFILFLHFPTQHPIELCILESIKTLRCKKQPFPYRLSFIMIK